MKNHWLWAGGFLALSVGGIAYGAVRGVTSSLAEIERRHAAADHEDDAPRDPAEADDALQREMREAIVLGKQGDFVGATAVLERLVARHPDRPSLWLNLGIARTGAGDLDGARFAFERVRVIDPKDWDAVAELAGLAIQQGEGARAIELAEAIPAGQGRMKVRLENDPLWRGLARDARLSSLREKHGLASSLDTSEVLAQELAERRRQGSEAPDNGSEGGEAPPDLTLGDRVGLPLGSAPIPGDGPLPR